MRSGPFQCQKTKPRARQNKETQRSKLQEAAITPTQPKHISFQLENLDEHIPWAISDSIICGLSLLSLTNSLSSKFCLYSRVFQS
jgi:hypothetical protein